MKLAVQHILRALCCVLAAAPHQGQAQAEPSVLARSFVIQAVRSQESVRVDGRLREPVWQAARPASEFSQNEPAHGQPAAFDTEVRVLYDATHLYVGAVLHDTLGHDGLRVPALQRDFDDEESDVFSLILDPFGDERNAFVFQVNPYGAQRDLQVREGSTLNTDWNAVWTARTTMTDEGWTVEMAVPWSALRYPRARQGRPNSWKVNFARTLRRRGEVSGWAPWPRSYTPYHMQFAGELAGLVPPPPRTNVQVQPYVLAREERTGDASALSGLERSKIGGDVKWAPSTSTVLDVTINTDFAQADADEQIVNLNRYSVFFPEKRAFFLESAGIFDIGYDQFTPFYTRRIGLSETGQPIPLDVGLRLTRSTPRGQAGALLVRQREADEAPAAYFGVGRLSRNLGRGGARLGGLVVARHDEALGETPGVTNLVATLDGYTRLSPTARVTAFVSGSATRGAVGDGFASYLWIRNNADWGYVGFIQDIASREYNAATGFIFRRDILLNSPAATFDWRPAWRPAFVRSFLPGFTNYTYHRLSDGSFLEANLSLRPIRVLFQNGAEVTLSLKPVWQDLDAEDAAFFRPLGVRLAPGRYRYVVCGLEAQSDLSRRLAGIVEAETGAFYDGRLTTVSTEVLAKPSPHVFFRGRYELNAARRLGPAAEEVTSHLVGAEANLALNPRVRLTAFYQYNTLEELGAWNVRLSYEYRPLSYVYLVVNDTRYFVSSTERRLQPEAFETRQQVILKVSYVAQL